jgi:hypothetical protein
MSKDSPEPDPQQLSSAGLALEFWLHGIPNYTDRAIVTIRTTHGMFSFVVNKDILANMASRMAAGAGSLEERISN